MNIDLPELGVVAAIARGVSRRAHAQVDVTGPWGSGKTLAAVQTARRLGVPAVFITAGRLDAEAVHDDLTTFAGEEDAVLLPAWEVLPDDIMAPADDVVAERLDTLQKLGTALDEGRPLCGVLPVRAFLQRVLRRKHLAERTLLLELGKEYVIEDLLERLVKMGYEREVMVEQRGQMSVRGGIFDIFPISAELPYRIEFFGDEIESMRRFEPETQRSVDRAEQVRVLPRSEKRMVSDLAMQPDGLATILDYFPKDALVVLDEPLAIREEAQHLEEQFGERPYFMPWDEAAERMARFRRITLAQLAHATPEEAVRVQAPMLAISGWTGKPDGFWDQLKEWDVAGYKVRLFCVNAGERRRLLELVEEHGYRIGQDAFDLRVETGRLRAGFTSPHDQLAMLSEREMFGRHYMRRTRRRFEAGAIVTQFTDLKSGDYIVHQHHGIGRYLGLKRFEGRSGDYLTLQYSGGDVLYVPVTLIDQIQKYVGGDGAIAKVDKIGGATWARTRGRVKKAVREMTEELVKLYAAREHGVGTACAPDTPWQREFEDSFPYDETPDQLRAIEDAKRDMESPRCMDRLICGDVGYGKTEVALRAAFKCIMDGRQAAVLAPTTVLVHQHYQTFLERMADFPVRVDVLSRFRSQAEQKQTLDRLKAGEVDVVIGTHRLISKDVRFKNLGLVVIDEEHRFGVGHKEKLKKARVHVDVLTMSATPIPRTLNFSLLGIRDMSLINTAPNDRLPIHTCIETWNERLVQEAIVRELSRQGQVFYLHNRVQTIQDVAIAIKKLVPRARIAVAHGQMPKHQLEEVMAGFVRKESDVLVCTTIIASGIDIPNANTIIIERADMFGLADLYQIRGRVGRYKHRAFAYLLIPGDRALTEEAQLRLKALEEFSALGSGYRIAMRDLEIRGCGNILGAEQHGNIAAVGYETYKDLIAEAVAEVKGEPLRHRTLPPFEVSVDAYIPENYVPVPAQKISLYRRIAGVASIEEVDEMQAELGDRYGRPPAPVRRLIEVMRARALGAELGVTRMAATKGSVTIEFESTGLFSSRAQQHLKQAFREHLRFSMAERPGLTYALESSEDDPVQAAQRVLRLLIAHEIE